MLLASYFILNRYGSLLLFLFHNSLLKRTDEIGKHTIYPYVHSFSNVPSRQAMLSPVSIPDVLPCDIPPTSNFSLVAGTSTSHPHNIVLVVISASGDFEEIYGVESQDVNEPQSGVWDAILTCFFIDTVRCRISSHVQPKTTIVPTSLLSRRKI